MSWLISVSSWESGGFSMSRCGPSVLVLLKVSARRGTFWMAMLNTRSF